MVNMLTRNDSYNDMPDLDEDLSPIDELVERTGCTASEAEIIFSDHNCNVNESFQIVRQLRSIIAETHCAWRDASLALKNSDLNTLAAITELKTKRETLQMIFPNSSYQEIQSALARAHGEVDSAALLLDNQSLSEN